MVTIRLPDEMKDKLEKIAQEQRRPLSNLLRLILIEWLEKREPEKKGKK